MPELKNKKTPSIEAAVSVYESKITDCKNEIIKEEADIKVAEGNILHIRFKINEWQEVVDKLKS